MENEWFIELERADISTTIFPASAWLKSRNFKLAVLSLPIASWLLYVYVYAGEIWGEEDWEINIRWATGELQDRGKGKQ